ncbi:MAG: alpha/beta fold hydrolase [Candidatus Woesearchaeota archaeon]
MRKKVKKKITKKLVIIAAVALLVIIILLFFLGIKVNFLTSNQMYIELSPLQLALEAQNNESVSINFSLSNRNFWLCRSRCNLTLYDPYAQKSMTQETITLNPNTRFARTYTIHMNTKGYGQRLYYLEAECSNIPSLLCQTQGQLVQRSALITINHSLSASDNALMQDYQQQLNNISQTLAASQELLTSLDRTVKSINLVISYPYDLTAQKTQLDASLAKLNQTIILWNSFNLKAIEVFPSQTLLALEKINTILAASIKAYNTNANIINNFNSNWQHFEAAYQYYAVHNLDKSETIEELAAKITANLKVFNQSGFQNRASAQLSPLNTSFNQAITQYLADKSSFENLTAEIIIKHQNIQNKISAILGKNSQQANGSCNHLNQLILNYQQLNAQSDYAGYQPYHNNSEFMLIRTEYQDSFQNPNLTIVYSVDHYVINQTRVNNTLNLTPQDYITSLSFSYKELEPYQKLACTKSTNTLPVINQTFTQILLTPTNKTYQPYVFKQPEPQCCIFSSCTPCTTETLYPTIFLHGHSPIENSPVEQSLTAFSQIQREMGHDGFVNAGDIDPSTLEGGSLWSLMHYPSTVRVSYYYLFFTKLGLATIRKSESIENYAIRFKELIDIVKARTGASKVNIVAHSMGGLVAREYLMLFGQADVNKLILIAVPNNGIAGRAMQFCSTIGSDKECQDMANSSIFMQRLNSFEPGIDVYTIYGQGCLTDGFDGDGIVSAKDAQLSYATNYATNGSCTDLFKTELHNTLLDPGLNPEVYALIVDILNINKS